MKTRWRNALVWFVILVACLGVGFVVYKLIGAIIGGIVGGLVVWYFIRKDLKDRLNAALAESQKPAVNVESLLQQLLELNITIRTEGFPDEVRDHLEAVIDILRDIVPKLNQRHQGVDVTWLVNRVVMSYLPVDIVGPFVALDDDQRDARANQCIESLSGLKRELRDIQESLRNQTDTNFAISARFLRDRFADSGIRI